MVSQTTVSKDSHLGFRPDWPLPDNVESFISYRSGGCSQASYASNNLATHVDDDPQAVAANRNTLCQTLGLGQPPLWLQQVHGQRVVDVHSPPNTEADGAVSDLPGIACAVLTADCLPILLCNKSGTQVAAVHGGWRSLSQGIVENAIAKFQDSGTEIMAFLGPAISATVYEVGPEVANAFSGLTADRSLYVQPNTQRQGHYFLDLYAVARLQLQRLGVNAIYGGDRCCYRERDYFFSYRRDGVTGRMASLIWLVG